MVIVDFEILTLYKIIIVNTILEMPIEQYLNALETIIIIVMIYLPFLVEAVVVFVVIV